MPKILIIDDNAAMRDGMALTLERAGHECLTASGGREGIERYEADPAVALVLTDLRMDGVDGMGVLRAVLAAGRDTPVVLITAYATVEEAVGAMALGAADYLTKPVDASELVLRIGRAIDRRKLERENVLLRAETETLRQQSGLRTGGLLGESPAIRAVLDQIDRVAASDSTVFIGGESGTGKELAARAIHAQSRRASGPFVVANCSAFAETLLESELFGHEKGAFTGASARHIGRFEMAQGGTLFLDEVGDISLAVQVKLLRVLQERRIERVGGERAIDVDVRVISATHRDLRKLVSEGKFRDDLFYRLHIVPILLPPLRDRLSDVSILAAAFIARSNARLHRNVAGIAPTALRSLEAHTWPGNVRELENVLEYAMVMHDVATIDLPHLPPLQPHGSPASGTDFSHLVGQRPLAALLDSIERSLIAEALERSNGNRSEAARLLGVKTGAFFYKLDKYGFKD